MSVWDGGFASAEGVDPPDEGDWVIRGNTAIDSADIYAPGNITIEANATVHIVNTTLTMNRSTDRQHTLLVEDGAKLFIYGGTVLILDRLEAEPGSAIELEDCEVRTRSEMLLWSQNIFADTVVLKNIAPNAEPDNDGRAALMVLDGSIEGNLLNVDIQNYGGHAGLTSPGRNGSRGGNSILISNVSQWSECTIDCRAGDSKSGGLGLPGTAGRSGGPGANALVRLNCTKFENTTIEAIASDGGLGAQGYDNVNGDGDDGGNGAIGGNAYILMEIPIIMEIAFIDVQAYGGSGGTAGPGGYSIDGDAGNGGIGADGGSATIEISSKDDLAILRTGLMALGGSGGWGGDCGRLEGGTGYWGAPGPAGNGGPATIRVNSLHSIDLSRFRADCTAGRGLDGGGGYDQGERGGRGGDAELRVRAQSDLNGKWVYLNASGGQGGNGGPAYSEIEGNGGDGGDALVEFTGLLEMSVERFTIHANYGPGGTGRDPIYNGADGIPTLDLDTQVLWMAEGVLNMPLDDLHGDAVGELYNVTFDMEFGIPGLPIGNSVMTTSFPVIVLAVDHDDPPKAKPLEGYEVTVIAIDTGAFVAQSSLDENGEAYFNLQSARYTSDKVEYLGSYYFFVATPDGKRTKKVRGEIQGPSTIRIVMRMIYPMIEIEIEKPVEGTEYRLFSEDDLEASGHIVSGDPITHIYIQLVPEDGDPDQWPIYKLGLSPIPLSEVQDLEYKWGKYFSPEEHGNKWTFFFRFPMTEENITYFTETWLFNIFVHTELDVHSSFVSFDLLLDVNIGIPRIIQYTPIDGRTFNETDVLVEGFASDDYQLVTIEVRIDGGDWMPTYGTYEWSYLLDTGQLRDGEHTLDFRAYDGEHYSEETHNTFIIDKVQSSEGEPDCCMNWNLYFFILGGSILVVVGLVVIYYQFLFKRRKPPHS